MVSDLNWHIYFLRLNISLFYHKFWFQLRKYIKSKRQCLITFPNILRLVKNTFLCIIFSTSHCLEMQSNSIMVFCVWYINFKSLLKNISSLINNHGILVTHFPALTVKYLFFRLRRVNRLFCSLFTYSCARN